MRSWFAIVPDVNVTEQVPPESVQGLPPKTPFPSVTKLTAPVAALGVTVAVQVAGAFNTRAAQVTVVSVAIAASPTVEPKPAPFSPATSSATSTTRAAP